MLAGLKRLGCTAPDTPYFDTICVTPPAGVSAEQVRHAARGRVRLNLPLPLTRTRTLALALTLTLALALALTLTLTLTLTNPNPNPNPKACTRAASRGIHCRHAREARSSCCSSSISRT